MKRWIAIFCAMALALPLCACGQAPAAAGTERLCAPDVPEQAPYPDESLLTSGDEAQRQAYDRAYARWSEQRRQEWEAAGRLDKAALDAFARELLVQCLGADTQENLLLSPANIWLALAMLSETVEGESREEVLALLGGASPEQVRENARALWQANYRDDGMEARRLAASLWLSDQAEYDPTLLSLLTRDYYASAYAGRMGSEAMDEALRAWLSEQTGGLLDGQLQSVRTDPQTLMALCATVYLKTKWREEFDEAETRERVFHSPAGELERPFMHDSRVRDYAWGERFSAVSLPMENGGALWLILPDGDLRPEALLEDEEAMAFLLSPGETENTKRLVVDLALPRFDVSAEMDLSQVMKTLGVRRVFQPGQADFSPLLPKEKDAVLSAASHAARVKLDEKGCEAAAYTVMMAAGSAMPPEEEIDFVADRPFLFVITGAGDTPLFAGLIRQP